MRWQFNFDGVLLHFFLTVLFSLLTQAHFPFDKSNAQQPLAGIPIGENAMPHFTVDWGTYSASSYDQEGDFYVFKNVKYGAAPTGPLRFQRSRFPESVPYPEDTLLEADTSEISCYSINLQELRQSCANNSTLEGTPFGNPHPGSQSEDCLYLDLYVPASSFSEKSSSIPVVVWFYGGAYISGAKSIVETDGMLYGGTGPMRIAHEYDASLIYVVGNYRLGAFGWLAGDYMEEKGYPNAGLSDQRLMLEFVNKFISKVGGDPTRVSVWGESAGGSSIIHHLTAENGTRDPLFSRALVQSPAYAWAWDRKGALNNTYSEFAHSVGCLNGSMTCMQGLDSGKLSKHNHAYIKEQYCKYNTIPFGPAVDNGLVTTLTPLAFQNGAYWKGIESLIVSHVVHESDTFIPDITNTEQAFKDFLKQQFPNCSPAVDDIINSPLYAISRHSSQRGRLIDVARDAFFTSNVRDLFNVYGNTTGTTFYSMQYRYPYVITSRHGFDLLPTFWYSGVNISDIIEKLKLKLPPGAGKIIKEYMKYFAPNYQSRLVGHAITGDPNVYLPKGYVQWPTATSTCISASSAGTMTSGACQAGSVSAIGNVAFALEDFFTFFKIETDNITTDDRRAFWTNIAGIVMTSCTTNGAGK